MRPIGIIKWSPDRRPPVVRRRTRTPPAFVDPDGFVADPAYDAGVVLRNWCPELLAGDPRAVAGRYCDVLGEASGLHPVAVREWGFLERVSTGLYLMRLGAHDLARPFLEAAERLA
jgi:streptomycin 6-kinase